MLVPRTFTVLFLLTTLSISPCSAGEPAHLYDRPVLEADFGRYNQLIEQLYRHHFQPHLTPHQRAQLDSVEYQLPYAGPDDEFMDFSVAYHHGRPIVVLPVASLKLFEDLSTAFAWIWSNGYRFDTVDLYLAMLKHKSESAVPAGRYPDPLQALNVPHNALENRRVDEMSLRLRNSGLAFILAHSLGQIIEGQRNIGPLTRPQIQERQMETDRFTFDLLERARIIPMGVVVYLHARTFASSEPLPYFSVPSSMAHSPSQANRLSSATRLIAMAQTIADQGMRESDPERRESFLSLAERLTWIASVGKDGGVQHCLETVARSSTMDALVLTADTPGSRPLRWCR